MKLIKYFGFFVLMTLSGNSVSDDESISKAIDFLHSACVSGGEKVTFEANGDAGITLKKWKDTGITGEIKFKSEEIKGITGELTEFSLQQAEGIRECMKPYIKRIIDVILGEPIDVEAEQRLKSHLSTLINSIGLTMHVSIPIIPGTTDQYFESMQPQLNQFIKENFERDSASIKGVNLYSSIRNDSKLYEKLSAEVLPLINYGFVFYSDPTTKLSCLEARRKCKPDMVFEAVNIRPNNNVSFAIQKESKDGYILKVSIDDIAVPKFSTGLKMQSINDLRGSLLYITGPSGLRPNPSKSKFLMSWELDRLIMYIGRGINIQVTETPYINRISYLTSLPRDQWTSVVIHYPDFKPDFVGGIKSYKMRVDKYTFPSDALEFTSLVNSIL